LLILRFVFGLALAALAHVAGNLVGTAGLFARCVVDCLAVLIWIGLWTPLAAVTGAAIQIGVIILGHGFDLSQLIIAAVGLSLALLGPGAWSLDARLFGRKRLM
jgi:putative oxidoreductase